VAGAGKAAIVCYFSPHTQPMLRQIPNTLTCLNLLCGVWAIINALNANFLAKEFGLEINFSAILIVVAAVFDLLDGLTARLLKAQSEIGAQLDSLADLVSFGVAPAMMLVSMMLYTHAHLYEDNLKMQLGLGLVSLIPVFSAIRLARFNLLPSKTGWFSGLPTPGNALVLASIPLMLGSPYWGPITQPLLTGNTTMLLAVLSCFLLVAPIPLLSIKFKGSPFVRHYWPQWMLIATAALLLILLGVAAGIPILVAYLGISLVAKRLNAG
jgi:CDP-diacylglycerol--serine O-phosphatidyltransferase